MFSSSLADIFPFRSLEVAVAIFDFFVVASVTVLWSIIIISGGLHIIAI